MTVFLCELCGAAIVDSPSKRRRFCSRACQALGHRSDPVARFWSRVDLESDPHGCWLWTGARSGEGYGTFMVEGRTTLVHRFAYELLVGPIPDGLHIDHVRARGCRNRNCVNPGHLEPVSLVENLMRGDTVSTRNAAKTHCPYGHDYDGRYPNGYRYCRRCAAERQRRHRALKKAA